MVDETVVSAGYDLIYGLAEDSSKPRVVRGGWTPDGSDFSMLNPANHPLVDLPEEKKSRLYMDVILTRNDANNFLFHLCMVPQMPANDSVACSAHKLLHWMGVPHERGNRGERRFATEQSCVRRRDQECHA